MPALIGALRVSLSADTAAFHSGMKRAEAQARSSGTAISKSLGLVKAGFAGLASGISIGLITQGVKAALDYAGSLGEVAQQLGVTTKELQTFRYAVSQNGGTVEEADKALGKFSVSVSKALSGSKQATAAFAAMGVSLDDLRTKGKTELIGQIADNMKKAGGASANAAAGVALFSRGFQKLIPTLNLGSEGMNALAQAADELGIVLSDEQIQNADKTADKLDALMTVLKAKIAGDVADNADSIFQFIDALFQLVRAAEKAREALVNFQQNYNLPNLLFKGDAFGKGVAGRNVTTPLSEGGSALAIAKKMGLKVAGSSSVGGGSPPQFLASGGGAKRARRGGADDAERKRLEALRDAFQFEEEQRRADIDILRAKQQLATDYVERTALSIQMLNLEQEGFEAELQYRISAKELTTAQADQLRAKFAINDALQRQIVLEEEEADRLKDYSRLDQLELDLKRDQLESEAQLAETASERRAIELRILDVAIAQEQLAIDQLAASKDWADQEEARRRQINLDATSANDRAAVIAGTRGPMEDWLASLPTTAAKAQEALERLQVDAFEGLIDAAVLLTEGFDGAKDALLGTLKSFLQGLLRMQLQKGLASILGNSGIRLPGFAFGGFTGRTGGIVHANEFVLNAAATSRLGVPSLEALNRGASLATVSNDNGRGPTIQNFNFPNSDYDSFRRNQRQMARDARRGLAIQ